jgi:hypothetical protein
MRWIDAGPVVIRALFREFGMYRSFDTTCSGALQYAFPHMPGRHPAFFLVSLFVLAVIL